MIRSMMLRKPLAFAIVLLIAVLAPATVIIGFCARMPCCGHASTESVVLTTEGADCCTTIACYESPSGRLATRASAHFFPVAVPLLVVNAPALSMPAPSTAAADVETSQPRAMGLRLATLSTLII